MDTKRPTDDAPPKTMDELSAELAELTPAERFEKLLTFPTVHTFKLIGKVGGPCEDDIAEAVRKALAELGHCEVTFDVRFSSGTKYLSLSFNVAVGSGAELAGIYDRLSKVPGVMHLL